MRLAVYRLMPLLAIFMSVPAMAEPAAYLLNPGDAVQVSVWREEGLQREVRVLPDGSITFPLAGRVDVAGLNSTDAATRIAAKLKDYLSEPNVTVVITGIEGNRAYVLGKVPKPGAVIMSGVTTVMQALSMAGGLDKFADESAVRIIRRRAGGEEIINVNYKDLVSGRNLASNVVLVAGDTIVVP